jgi:hypothetical protein
MKMHGANKMNKQILYALLAISGLTTTTYSMDNHKLPKPVELGPNQYSKKFFKEVLRTNQLLPKEHEFCVEMTITNKQTGKVVRLRAKSEPEIKNLSNQLFHARRAYQDYVRDIPTHNLEPMGEDVFINKFFAALHLIKIESNDDE